LRFSRRRDMEAVGRSARQLFHAAEGDVSPIQ
jgi:hypothetical protein